ncbi:hypothetical protein G7Y89_g539 [Cudoniella acicularis]|uniref:Uncharacterized protein n=1 Tax=Cudoniella acicularis TaxID=354080 RepID=A0A8H4RYK8_9HELO|nr:hypothetical protein G7Y89_g539 [Cudoniella acicularis]
MEGETTFKLPKCGLHGLSGDSTLSDVATSLAPEPASIRALYQGEDSRVTQLRHLDDKLQEWAAPSFGGKFEEQEGQPDNQVTISIENGPLLPTYNSRFYSTVHISSWTWKILLGLGVNHHNVRNIQQHFSDLLFIIYQRFPSEESAP